MVGGAPGLLGLGVVQVAVKDIEIDHVTTHHPAEMEVVREIRRIMKDVKTVRVKEITY